MVSYPPIKSHLKGSDGTSTLWSRPETCSPRPSCENYQDPNLDWKTVIQILDRKNSSAPRNNHRPEEAEPQCGMPCVGGGGDISVRTDVTHTSTCV